MPDTAASAANAIPKPILLRGSILESYNSASHLEWLETNGIGGWASGTVAGANTRRYHGVLVAATKPPTGRAVLLSKLDETLRLDGVDHPLSTNQFPDVVHPEGYQHLLSFERGLFPVFRYGIGAAILEKKVAAINGENTMVLSYRLSGTTASGTLRLRPLIAGREIHALRRAEVDAPGFGFESGLLTTTPLVFGVRLYLAVPGGSLECVPELWRNFSYQMERQRGFDWQEDLWTPGEIEVPMEPGSTLHIVVSTDDPSDRDPTELLVGESIRREALLDRLPVRDHFSTPLALAADQFLVRRSEDRRTVIAGYHWFADWGRDAMIALPGLTLATGRSDEAARILQTFGELFDQGMLPNCFPDDGAAPEYNSVDAALWFFVALRSYWKATGDSSLIKDLLPALRESVRWHREGTRHGIQVCEDGLLRAGVAGVQLTWMDAKVGETVVTPRIGKPVEINALWINALAILAEMEDEFGDVASGIRLARATERAAAAFDDQFWNPDGGYLYDVIDGADRDASLRPNQLLALSLPRTLLSPVRRQSVLRVVEESLLTPVGLRSLGPHDSSYQPEYLGDAQSRDEAYHQGTVWPWLLGPFVTAIVRERGARGREQGRTILEGLIPHLGEAGVGSVSEIFDGGVSHAPRGAIAQAWSVAELLRAWVLTAPGQDPKKFGRGT